MSKRIRTVADVPGYFSFTNLDTDVKAINEIYGTDYDSFFVDVGEGEYLAVYGLHGIIPDNDKPVYKVKGNV
jgi:hypothetical protein